MWEKLNEMVPLQPDFEAWNEVSTQEERTNKEEFRGKQIKGFKSARIPTKMYTFEDLGWLVDKKNKSYILIMQSRSIVWFLWVLGRCQLDTIFSSCWAGSGFAGTGTESTTIKNIRKKLHSKNVETH